MYSEVQQRGISADASAMMAFESRRKSAGVAYLLLIFLGGLGAHRFYLGRPLTAVLQLLLTVSGLVFGVPLIALGLWLLIDLFITAGMVRSDNEDLIDQIENGSWSR
jgi:TM2 domain-containing membrane protein YozV